MTALGQVGAKSPVVTPLVQTKKSEGGAQKPDLNMFQMAKAKIGAFTQVTGEICNGAEYSQYESDARYSEYKQDLMDKMISGKSDQSAEKPKDDSSKSKLNFFQNAGANIKAFLKVTGEICNGANYSQMQSDALYDMYSKEYKQEMMNPDA